jgi:hypothetical protein
MAPPMTMFRKDPQSRQFLHQIRSSTDRMMKIWSYSCVWLIWHYFAALEVDAAIWVIDDLSVGLLSPLYYKPGPRKVGFYLIRNFLITFGINLCPRWTEIIFCVWTSWWQVDTMPSSSALIPMSICTLQCLFSHSFITYEWLNRDCDGHIYIRITSRWTGYRLIWKIIWYL